MHSKCLMAKNKEGYRKKSIYTVLGECTTNDLNTPISLLRKFPSPSSKTKLGNQAFSSQAFGECL